MIITAQINFFFFLLNDIYSHGTHITQSLL